MRSCTFNIISVVAAVDYGGNSIGVGLVTRVFFSAPAEPHQPHQPPTMRQQTGEERQHPALSSEIFSNYCSSDITSKYSQMIAAPWYYGSSVLLSYILDWCWQPLVPQLLSDGHHLSHIGSIEPPTGGGGESLGSAGFRFVSVCSLPSICWDGCCLNGNSDSAPTKVASPAGVVAPCTERWSALHLMLH